MILTKEHIGKKVKRPQGQFYFATDGIVTKVGTYEGGGRSCVTLKSKHGDTKYDNTFECGWELIEEATVNTKIDKNKIKETISKLPICADGKKGVTALVEQIIGEPLKDLFPKELVVMGSVWNIKGAEYILARSTETTGFSMEQEKYVLTCVGDGNLWTTPAKLEGVVEILERAEATHVFKPRKYCLEGKL